MAGYNELRGLRVKYLSADPANPEDGQVWYNSTTGNLRVQGIGVASFSSGAPLSLARQHQGSENVGTQTAGLAFGGQTSTLPTIVTNTEQYNGSGWSTGGGLNTARTNLAGSGTQTAGLGVGGSTGGPPVAPTAQTVVEEYNGSSWTEVNDISTARGALIGTGPQTATFVAGGFTIPSALSSATEEYDGTNWTTGGSMPASRENFAGTGDSGDGLVCGGKTTLTSTFLYNGTAWSDGPSLNNGVQSHAAIGPTTNVIRLSGFAASGGRTTSTENYDGTSWSSYPATMGTGRDISVSAGGNATSGLVAGGNDGSSAVGTTEELNFSSTTVTPAAWSSANAPSSPVYGGATGGTPTAAFLAAGFGTGSEPATQKTFNQHYNGTSWSEENDLNTARFYVGGAGTQTASLVFGGRIVPSPPVNNNSEEYDGSSWTAGNTIGTARQFGGSNGTQTAALAIGGTSPTNAVEEYDGTNWTSGTVYPTSDTANAVRSVGPQTAAFAVGGFPATTNTNFYDGSTWTAGPSLVAPTGEGNMSGSQTVAIKAGGNLGGTNYTNQSVRYDGTSWATSANLGTGRGALPSGPSGDFSSTTALCFGGPLGPPTFEANQLEEFTGETVTTNPASNLSVS